MPSLSRVLTVAATSLVLTAGGVATTVGVTSSAAVASRWAPAATAAITPGVQMLTAGAQCTGNFVFTDDRARVYVGYAAHCAGKGQSTDTNGCATGSLPLGTPVTFAKGVNQVSSGTKVGSGRLAYSSWRTMRRLRTTNQNACAYNDLALVRVAGADVGKVNPSVPHWGGPTGLRSALLAPGDSVLSYGNSSVRPGIEATNPKTGTVLGRSGQGWTYNVFTFTPGIPGDSGSGFLDAQGRAFGVLSTLDLAPNPGSNGVGNLAKELAFAQRHSGIPGLRLVKGTVPFSG